MQRSRAQKNIIGSSLVAAAGLAVLLAGCGQHNATSTGGGSSTGPGAGGGSALQIAVIPKGTSHEYWKSIHAGANKAQQDLQKQGTNINILWKGTESEGDRNGQVNIVETFITQHVAGIVLAPLDNQALVTPVHDAVTHKIPVVIVDSSLKSDDYTSFCATDNEKGGELAGDEMGKLLNGKGRVIVLNYAQGSASTEARETGFLTAIAKYPGIAILSDNQYGGPTTDTANKTSQNLLARFGTKTDGVFASNESNTRGMRLALKDANLLKKVKFVGFDAAPDLVDALKAGEIQGIVVQNPFKMGYLGVTTLVDAIHGKTVPKNVDTGVALVTADNMNQPAMQEYLNPPIAQYLQ
ncbi:MAG: ABC transporter substrate-binding protein [Janthinobacterium lividum]